MIVEVSNINVAKLADELLASNIHAVVRGDGAIFAKNATVYVESDVDMQLVQAIIDAHDPTPVLPAPTTEERIHELEQENKLLKAQNAALVEQTEFHEEVLTEIILAINS